MRNPILLGVAVLTLVAGTLPAQAAGTDPALSACVTCHDTSPAKNKLVGPGLYGVYGAKPVTPGISFAKWDEKSLDTWLKDPSKVKPGTLMSYSVGNPKKRAAAVKALKSLK